MQRGFQFALAEDQQAEGKALGLESGAAVEEPPEPFAGDQTAHADHQEPVVRDVGAGLVLFPADGGFVKDVVCHAHPVGQTELLYKRFPDIFRDAVDVVELLIAPFLVAEAAEEPVLPGVGVHVDVDPGVFLCLPVGGVGQHLGGEGFEKSGFHIVVPLQKPLVDPFRGQQILHYTADQLLQGSRPDAERRPVMDVRGQEPGAGVIVEERLQGDVVFFGVQVVHGLHQNPLGPAAAKAVNEEHDFPFHLASSSTSPYRASSWSQ